MKIVPPDEIFSRIETRRGSLYSPSSFWIRVIIAGHSEKTETSSLETSCKITSHLKLSKQLFVGALNGRHSRLVRLMFCSCVTINNILQRTTRVLASDSNYKAILTLKTTFPFSSRTN